MSADEDALRNDLDELAGLVNAARGMSPTGVGSVRVNVSAGGVAVWIAATACAITVAVVLTAMVFVAIGQSDLQRQAAELRERDAEFAAYVNAGYVTPEDPEEEKEP